MFSLLKNTGINLANLKIVKFDQEIMWIMNLTINIKLYQLAKFVEVYYGIPMAHFISISPILQSMRWMLLRLKVRWLVPFKALWRGTISALPVIRSKPKPPPCNPVWRKYDDEVCANTASGYDKDCRKSFIISFGVLVFLHACESASTKKMSCKTRWIH